MQVSSGPDKTVQRGPGSDLPGAGRARPACPFQAPGHPGKLLEGSARPPTTSVRRPPRNDSFPGACTPRPRVRRQDTAEAGLQLTEAVSLAAGLTRSRGKAPRSTAWAAGRGPAEVTGVPTRAPAHARPVGPSLACVGQGACPQEGGTSTHRLRPARVAGCDRARPLPAARTLSPGGGALGLLVPAPPRARGPTHPPLQRRGHPLPWLPALSGGAGGLRFPRGLPAPRPLGAELGARDGGDTDPSAWAAHAGRPITPAHTPYTHHTHTPNTRPPRARKTRAPRQRTHTAHTTRATPGPRPDAANARTAHARPTLTRDRDAGGCARGTGAQRPHSRSHRAAQAQEAGALPFALRRPTLPSESLQRRGAWGAHPWTGPWAWPLEAPTRLPRGRAGTRTPRPRRARGGLGARLTPGRGRAPGKAGRG